MTNNITGKTANERVIMLKSGLKDNEIEALYIKLNGFKIINHVKDD